MSSDMRKLINEMKTLVESIQQTTLTPEEINQVLHAYLVCALWTEEEQLEKDEADRLGPLSGDEDGEDAVVEQEPLTIDDIDNDSKIQAYLDIKKFLSMVSPEAVQEMIHSHGLSQIGHDLWLTRNGHGVGFWDRGLDHGDELSNAAKELKSADLYLGDDGSLHFSNAY